MRANMKRAAARTRNVMTKRMNPSASSDEVNSPGSASANWLAIIAEIVVPWARTGILGSVFLALARALGETMAVTMVIGNDPKISASLFAPGYTIAAVIANEFTEATGDLYLSALIELGLVLFLMTFILNGLARLLIVATERGKGHPS